ncbi:MAG: T9SS type A sorting domain-containing protein [Fibrobacterota bacterium]
MRYLLRIAVLATFAAVYAQSSVTGEVTQVSSYTGEDVNNAGGKVSCRVGNGPGYYSTLIRLNCASTTLMLPCTLFFKQYAFSSGGTQYDYDSAAFNTTLSSVVGNWNNGSASETAQDGSVCYKYRSYSTSAPVNWVSGSSSSTLESASNGQGGSHVNSTPAVIKMMVSGQMCYAVLDSQLVFDLANGCGGLRIVRASGQSGEMRISNDANVKIRWNPSGTPIAVEKSAVNRPAALSAIAFPNPANYSTNLRFTSAGRELPIRIFTVNGMLVRTLDGSDGQALWDNRDAQGRLQSNGVYVYRITEAGKTVQGRFTITR